MDKCSPARFSINPYLWVIIMISKNVKMLGLVVLSAISLSACGEGWEAQKTTDYFPYGNQRTAGSGVVYVRAKLLPERQLNLNTIKEVVKPAAQIMGADDVFKKVMRK